MGSGDWSFAGGIRGNPELLARYEVLERVGEGTFGEVFRAKRKTDGLIVALKEIRDSECSSREAEALLALNHPNIVKLVEYFVQGSNLVLVLEYLPSDLAQVIHAADGRLPESEIKGWMVQILCGVAACHRASLLHRDLKPSNLLVATDGTLKIADFGQARVVQEGVLLHGGKMGADPCNRAGHFVNIYKGRYADSSGIKGYNVEKESINAWIEGSNVVKDCLDLSSGKNQNGGRVCKTPGDTFGKDGIPLDKRGGLFVERSNHFAEMEGKAHVLDGGAGMTGEDTARREWVFAEEPKHEYGCKVGVAPSQVKEGDFFYKLRSFLKRRGRMLIKQGKRVSSSVGTEEAGIGMKKGFPKKEEGVWQVSNQGLSRDVSQILDPTAVDPELLVHQRGSLFKQDQSVLLCANNSSRGAAEYHLMQAQRISGSWIQKTAGEETNMAMKNEKYRETIECREVEVCQLEGGGVTLEQRASVESRCSERGQMGTMDDGDAEEGSRSSEKGLREGSITLEAGDVNKESEELPVRLIPKSEDILLAHLCGTSDVNRDREFEKKVDEHENGTVLLPPESMVLERGSTEVGGEASNEGNVKGAFHENERAVDMETEMEVFSNSISSSHVAHGRCSVQKEAQALEMGHEELHVRDQLFGTRFNDGKVLLESALMDTHKIRGETLETQAIKVDMEGSNKVIGGAWVDGGANGDIQSKNEQVIAAEGSLSEEGNVERDGTVCFWDGVQQRWESADEASDVEDRGHDEWNHARWYAGADGEEGKEVDGCFCGPLKHPDVYFGEETKLMEAEGHGGRGWDDVARDKSEHDAWGRESAREWVYGKGNAFVERKLCEQRGTDPQEHALFNTKEARWFRPLDVRDSYVIETHEAYEDSEDSEQGRDCHGAGFNGDFHNRKEFSGHHDFRGEGHFQESGVHSGKQDKQWEVEGLQEEAGFGNQQDGSESSVGSERGKRESELSPFVGTRWYKAPELLYGATKYGRGVDIWAVGCIFAELLGGEPLFPGITDIDQLSRVVRVLGAPNEKVWPGVSQLPDFGKIDFSDERQPLSFCGLIPRMSQSSLRFLEKLLVYDPAQRLGAEAALRDSYFQEEPLPDLPHELQVRSARRDSGASEEWGEWRDPGSPFSDFELLDSAPERDCL